MPDIPQLTNPITSKSYNYSPRPTDGVTAPFDIVQLTQVQGADGSKDKQTRSQLNMGQRELVPLSVQVTRDPTLAVEVLKDLLNVEVLKQALVNGHTELHGKLENLAKTLYLSPNNLTDEILSQEQQNTMFSNDEFYNILREVAKTSMSVETKETVGSLLKALNFAQNKSEILNALSANMKFLSEYFSPNQALSQKLAELSAQWSAKDAGEYFEILKAQTLTILKDVSGSLLNDEKTQTLLPLIVHNLSRYNDNTYMLSENFNLLLSQIPSNTLSEALRNAFTRLAKKLYPDSPNYTDNTSFNNNTINLNQNQDNYENNVTKNDNIANQINSQNDNHSLNKLSDFLSQNLSQQDYLNNLVDIEENFNKNLMAYLSGRNSGMTSIKNSLQSLLVGMEGRKALPLLLNEFPYIDNMNDLIAYLNRILLDMPNIPLRQQLYENFNQIIEQMALKNELPPSAGRQPTNSVMETLTNFISENINHPALQSLDSFNATNLLQSLLNAPGVFTPLAHYILPLQIENTKAFGELWVDNDENNPNNTPSTQRNYHMFLTFDVETIGRFELDMYAFGADISLTLLYPNSYETKVEHVKNKVNSIISGIGYRTKAFNIAKLDKPHNLTEIFPKILDKRFTLNKKI